MRNVALLCLVFIVALLPGYAFAGEDATVDVLLPFLKDWPWLVKTLGFMFALQVFLRGVSESLIKLSDVLGPDVVIDNKIAAWCSEAAWVIGVVLSKVGYGVPTDVALEKAKNVVVGKPTEMKKN